MIRRERCIFAGMTLPNFLVIGTGKAGTTSLYDYLGQHPDICLSAIKETNYLDFEAAEQVPIPRDVRDRRNFFPVRSLAEYEALFSSCGHKPAIGEISPRYIYSPRAAQRIRSLIPAARMIAILRDPVERAWSSYLMYARDGYERRSFEQALADEEAGRNRQLPSGQWRYIETGFYFRHLSRYLELFDRSQIAIYLFEDLQADAPGLLRQIFGFLGVDESFVCDASIQRNRSGVPRNAILNWMTRKRRWTTAVKNSLPGGLRRRADRIVAATERRNLVRTALPEATRERLVQVYRADIERLEELLQRDLSLWKQPVRIPPAG